MPHNDSVIKWFFFPCGVSYIERRGTMDLLKNGLLLGKVGKFIEEVSLNGMVVGLMSSYDGTEIIHHKLYKDTKWLIKPSEGWDALEFIYLLRGELELQLDSEKVSLQPGQHLSALPIKESCHFTAKVESEFLYVTSQPVFHHYSNLIRKFKELAVSVEKKDGYTAEHCSRIAKYSTLIGEKLGFNSRELHLLNVGAYLHDIGKVKIPDHILNKPGKLSDEEWNIMKSHSTEGKKILEESNFPSLVEAALIVEQHHERYNGSGYPYGLKKEEILLSAYIIAVVDSYDAMTTDRIYRKAMTKQEALTEIRNGKGTLYHPDAVNAFLSFEDIL